MRILDRFRSNPLTESHPTSTGHDVELLTEALADAQLALEDAGWKRLTTDSEQAFTREGLRQAAAVARAMTVTNALVRRGVALRISYIWGAGLQITARAAAADGATQDVNTTVQDFLDDEGNRAAVTGEQAHEELERALATDGNVFIVLFTAPRTGRVQVRTLDFDEIDDVITNPQDRKEAWFYVRRWTEVTRGADGTRGTLSRVDYYPALGYRPAVRQRMIDNQLVHWDAPVLHISVNRLSGWKFGVGDVYTALPWARAYRDFLADWAQLVKALSRFAWKQTAKGSKTATVAAKARQAAATAAARPTEGALSAAGATAVMSPDVTFEAIPKTGATIDSESGRPLAAMVAAALDVPVTMLLGDPGTAGNRATAETLDEPTKLAMGMRRARWTEAHRRILGHVVAEAVRAPGGPLRGTILRDEHGREVLTLAGDTDTTVETTWPPLDKPDPTQRMNAVKAASDLEVLPRLEIARLALRALEVENIDEVLDALTDDQGNFVDPAVDAGVAAVAAFRRGQDPAEAVR